MKQKPLFFLVISACMLAACSDSHLEIFPPLEDPALMEQKLNPADMKEDIDAFYFGALERHPSLADYVDQETLDATMVQLKDGLKDPLSRVEFFRRVGQLTHTFGDGHSMLIWPYQEYEAIQAAGQKPFPFKVHIDQEDKIFIKESYTDGAGNSVTAGSEVTAINGLAASDLIETMQRYVGGETKYLRKQFVAGRFPIYLWAVHDVAGDFSVQLQTPAGASTVVVSNTQNWQPADQSNQPDEDFYVKNLGNGVAYLQVGTFDVDPDWFEDFIDDVFKRFKEQGATSLIVDIRTNTGGNTDTAQYLARHLADRPFRLVSKVREKLNADNLGWFDYKGTAGDIIDTDWDDWLDPMDAKTKPPRDTYVLISPITYSAGIVFATTVKDFGFATLIGQETGGNANQTAQGNLFNLPHSQLRAYITTRMLVRPSGSLAPGGVKPDYTIFATQQTLRDGKDVELEKALELIEQSR